MEPCEWLNKLLMDIWPNYIEPKLNEICLDHWGMLWIPLKNFKPQVIRDSCFPCLLRPLAYIFALFFFATMYSDFLVLLFFCDSLFSHGYWCLLAKPIGYLYAFLCQSSMIQHFYNTVWFSKEGENRLFTGYLIHNPGLSHCWNDYRMQLLRFFASFN